MNVITLITLLLFSKSSFAYIGPGLGLGIVVSILGLIFSIFLFIIALLWFPIKKLLKKNQNKKTKDIK